MTILTPLKPWPDDWAHLTPHHYNLIDADPPWQFEHYSEAGWDKSAEGQYETLPTKEIIKRFPVGELADPNCLLLLWTRAPMLKDGFRVMEAWGFQHVSYLHWRKVSRNGKQLRGTGHRVWSMGELVLVGIKGNPKHKPLEGNIDDVRRRHSEKPEKHYANLERFCPRLTRRLILFSRRSRAGWETTGNQRTIFDGATSHDLPRRQKIIKPPPPLPLLEAI